MARFPFRRPSEELELIGVDGARALLSRSGFEAFEHGTGLFDSPLLAYVPTAGHRPTFAIHDHRGVRLGRVLARIETARRRHGRSGHDGPAAATEIRHAAQQTVMLLQAAQEDNRTVVRGAGQVDATFVHDRRHHHRVGIFSAAFEGLGEPDFGLVVDPGKRSMAGPELRVMDLRNREVAVMRTVAAGRGRAAGYAVAINANCEGELRQRLVALPVVIEAIKADQGQVIDDVHRSRTWVI